MICLMFSPAFLSDLIGYGVRRIFYTAEQIAEMRMPDDTILSRVRIFPVACIDPNAPPADQRYWTEAAARNRWPSYPEAGPECFRPERNCWECSG